MQLRSWVSLRTSNHSKLELFISCEPIREWIGFAKVFVISHVSEVMINIPTIIQWKLSKIFFTVRNVILYLLKWILIRRKVVSSEELCY